jgi:hypothetical protein
MYLKNSLEAAYAAMARYFEIPVRENIFVGKLPVYMFDKQADFMKYAKEWDEQSLPDTVAGYYAGRSDGLGHLAMWRPMPEPQHGISARDAQTRWAYTLVHEFTHAFVARYRSNTDIPTWLNEGLAEILAQHEFPRRETRIQARAIAERRGDLSDLFTDDGLKTPSDYPVMQTVVEYLLYTNKNNFIPMINAIKDGSEPESALKKFYNLDYGTLEQQWRRDLQRR